MRPMKLLVQLEDNQCFQLKKLSLASLSESGNSGLKINKTFKAHNSSQEYARTKIQLHSERPDSILLFKAKNVCVALKLR